jgi:heat shock protein HslJ
MKPRINRYANRLGVLGLLAWTLTVPARAETLAGSEWRPTEIRGAPVAPAVEVFVRFEAAGRLQGHGGCNRFFGDWQTNGEQLAIGPIGATLMACGAATMALEQPFLEALRAATRWHRTGTELVLSDSAGQPLLHLSQRDWD